MAGHSKKEYFVIAVILTILTAIEVAIPMTMPKGLSRNLGLVALALGKATLVALFYMHLKSETKSLRMVVFVPMIFPAIYAIVLIVESIARSAFT